MQGFTLLILLVTGFVFALSYKNPYSKELRDKWKIYAYKDVKTCLRVYNTYNPEKPLVNVPTKTACKTEDINCQKSKLETSTTDDFDDDSDEDTDDFTGMWTKMEDSEFSDDLGDFDDDLEGFDYDDADLFSSYEDLYADAEIEAEVSRTGPGKNPHEFRRTPLDFRRVEPAFNKRFFETETGVSVVKANSTVKHPCFYPFGVIGTFLNEGFNKQDGFFKENVYAADHFHRLLGQIKERYHVKTQFIPFIQSVADQKKKGYNTKLVKESTVVIKH